MGALPTTGEVVEIEILGAESLTLGVTTAVWSGLERRRLAREGDGATISTLGRGAAMGLTLGGGGAGVVSTKLGAGASGMLRVSVAIADGIKKLVLKNPSPPRIATLCLNIFLGLPMGAVVDLGNLEDIIGSNTHT